MSTIGIVKAINLTRIYQYVYAVLIEQYLTLFPSILSIDITNPRVVKAMLKFMEVFLHVATTLLRFRFEASQVKFLFGIVKKVLSEVIKCIPDIQMPSEFEAYLRKYGPMKSIYRMVISLILVDGLRIDILEKDALDSFFNMILKMFTNTSIEDLFSYPKKLKAGFEFVMLFLKKFPQSFARVVTKEEFVKLFNILKDGSISIHQYICISCYEAINAIFDNYIKLIFSLEYIMAIQNILEVFLIRNIENFINGEIANHGIISYVLFRIIAWFKDRARLIIAGILARYGNGLRKDVRECVEGLGRFSECEIGNKEARKEFVRSVEGMIQVIKGTD